jgi:alpha-mannosidase
LTVINDAKHGYDVRGGDIGLSAVRSPVWAWHDPRELEPDGDFEYMDLGRQDFSVRLVPHAGDWREAGVVRLAAELNQPAFALLEAAHAGQLSQRRGFAGDDGGDVVLAVLKAAEDGDGAIVVRAFEYAGRAARARLEVLGRSWDADFGANEIKTFRLERDRVTEVDLLEWPPDRR